MSFVGQAVLELCKSPSLGPVWNRHAKEGIGQGGAGALSMASLAARTLGQGGVNLVSACFFFVLNASMVAQISKATVCCVCVCVLVHTHVCMSVVAYRVYECGCFLANI